MVMRNHLIISMINITYQYIQYAIDILGTRLMPVKSPRIFSLKRIKTFENSRKNRNSLHGYTGSPLTRVFHSNAVRDMTWSTRHLDRVSVWARGSG